MTRVLVCGSRNWTDYYTVMEVLNGVHRTNPIACIIEGGALGADRFARRWATDRGIAVETFEADWSLGRKAGPMRNRRMLAEGKPDRCIAFVANPPTPGTANMVRQARDAGVPVWEITE